jgi:hypothetical protein
MKIAPDKPVAPEVREVEALAKSSNVALPLALERAGVATSTYWRWGRGSEPSTKTIRKLKAAIHALGSEAVS